MLKLILISFLITANTYAFQLKIKKDNALVTALDIKSLQTIEVERKKFSAYTYYREASVNYEGVRFSKLLDLYVDGWRNAKFITFKALDGYMQSMKVKKFLRHINEHNGFLVYQEQGQKGFQKFKRKGKMLDPGPVALVWTGFSKTKKRPKLAWPYQLGEIHIKNDKK